MRWARRLTDLERVVILAALAATVVKLLLAATTLGTNDIGYWTEFAKGVSARGPVGVYDVYFPEAMYNHPPLAGYMLVVVNALHDVGIPRPFSLRVPASLADLATALLLFQIVRPRLTERQAAAAAIAVVWSPLLLIVSGFHGNTDPVFVAFVLLAVHSLDVKDRPVLAGLALGLAVSTKLIPIVVIPWLLWCAWRRSKEHLTKLAVGGGAVFVLLWIPPLLTQFTHFVSQVLLYRGIGLRQWGLPEVVTALPGESLLLAVVNGPGSLIAVAVAAASPFLALRRASRRAGVEQPVRAAAGSGLALAVFLALSPAFGMQYLSWGLAACYLFAPLALAHLWNLGASALAVSVYGYWAAQPPDGWRKVFGHAFTGGQIALGLVVWALLVLVVVWRPERTTPFAIPKESIRE